MATFIHKINNTNLFLRDYQMLSGDYHVKQ